jgi:hypothetical protein
MDPIDTDHSRFVSALKLVENISQPSIQLQQKLCAIANPNDCIDRGFVPEATAVAAGAIRPERGQRRLFAIADVGAGTSDFAAFITVPGHDQRGRIGEFARAHGMLEKEGNFLDSQVVSCLIKKTA